MATLRRLVTSGALLAATAITALLPVARPAAAAAECRSPGASGQIIAQTPPEQLTLAARRAWPTTTGRGVTVAVVDTGVDRGNAQLADAVRRGWDLQSGSAGGDVDCVSHGTAVAGLIAARPSDGIGFVGVAPGATILPVRVAERPTGTANAVGADELARAIRWATDHGARVVNISLAADRGTTSLLSAVRYAQDHDVLLIATAGVRSGRATGIDPPSYPASYRGVLAVGGVDRDGKRLSSAPLRSDIDLAAPGSDVLSTARVRGHAYWSGSDVAAAQVSGVAALVRAAYPTLSAAEVQRRLIATANPVSGGPGSPGYGGGMVDPYRAATEMLSAGVEMPGTEMPARTVDAVALRRDARWSTMGRVTVAATVVLLAVTAVAAAAVGLRRRMAAGRRTSAAGVPEPEAIGDARLVDLAELYYTPPKPPRPGETR